MVAMKYASLLVLALPILIANDDGGQPDARSSGNLIYSPKSKALLLFDGYTIHPPDGKNHVYSWDGKTWTKIEASGPDLKSLSTGAYNSKTKNIAIFGGIGSKGYESLLGDTWEFDGRQWNQVHTNDIGTRDHCKMVYADHLEAYVMYGGQNGKRVNDSSTWILKGEKWTEMNLSGPGGRFHFGMAYDNSRHKVVLYGGYNQTGLQQDTWEFDGKDWKKMNVEGPGPRGRFSMTYDESRKMVVLYGGDVWKKKVDSTIDPTGEVWDIRSDTWGWDGVHWKKISDDGPARMMAALGYDPVRKKLVLFGGGDASEINYADTWEFDIDKWVRVANNRAVKWNGKEYEKVK